jgi:putative ABC transport system permease protein
VHIVFGISIDGSEDVTTTVFDLKRGAFDATILRGRLPQARDEVALGPSTLQRAHKSVGDTITMSGSSGQARFRVVGSMLFPEGDLSFDDGAALTLAGGDLLLGATHDASQLHSVQFRWAAAVDAAAADAQLAELGMRPLTADAQIMPGAVTNLGRVRQMPHYLALFIGLLFVVTLAHTLVADRRSRSRDLCMLRAMGMTPRATGGIVAAQALTVVTIAAAIGLPLGLIVGGRVWIVIADRTHVVVSIVRPAFALMITIVVAFAITVIVAAFAMRRVLGARLSDALRVE